MRIKRRKNIDIVGLGSAHFAQFYSCDAAKIQRLVTEHGAKAYTAEWISELPHEDEEPVGTCVSTVEDSLIVASRFGAKTALIAKRGTDETGRRFADMMREYNVAYNTEPLEGGTTFKAHIYVDKTKKEPTILSVRGASDQLTDADIDADLIRHATYFVSDAYNLIEPRLRQSLMKASDIASDPHCKTKIVFGLGRERVVDDFRPIVEGYIKKYKPEILNGNRDEFTELVKAWGTDIDGLTAKVQEYVKDTDTEIAIITLGKEGAKVIVTGDEIVHIPAVHVPEDKIVEVTCAGDTFLGAFLAALCKGKSIEEAGRWGATAAALTIQLFGIKPEKNYREITASHPIRRFTERVRSGFSVTGRE